MPESLNTKSGFKFCINKRDAKIYDRDDYDMVFISNQCQILVKKTSDLKFFYYENGSIILVLYGYFYSDENQELDRVFNSYKKSGITKQITKLDGNFSLFIIDVISDVF